MPERNAYRGIASNPEAIADITRRREAGEALASIGKTYGVSRERIRQLCERWGVTNPKEAKAAKRKQLAQSAIEMLEQGKALNIGEVAGVLGPSTTTIRDAARSSGLDLEGALEKARSHQHDGKRFGMWEVLPGSYRREQKGDNTQPTALVDCRCDCGTERTVQLSNLQGGISRGCGCRNKDDGPAHRVTVPWRCLETDERQPNTSALAKRFGVNNLSLVRRLNRQENFIAPDRTTWIPLREEAVVHNPGFAPRGWTCVDTGQTWPSARALAKDLGISGSQLASCVQQGRTYCSADRQHFTPLGKEDLRRSAFVPRTRDWQQKALRCVETGETWPSANALAAELGVKPHTLRTSIRRAGAFCHNGRTYQHQPTQPGSPEAEAAAA